MHTTQAVTLIVWFIGIIFRTCYVLSVTLRYLIIFLDGMFSVSAFVYHDTRHIVARADIFSDKPCNSSADAAIVAHDFIRAVDGVMVLVAWIAQRIIHGLPYPLVIYCTPIIYTIFRDGARYAQRFTWSTYFPHGRGYVHNCRECVTAHPCPSVGYVLIFQRLDYRLITIYMIVFVCAIGSHIPHN